MRDIQKHRMQNSLTVYALAFESSHSLNAHLLLLSKTGRCFYPKRKLNAGRRTANKAELWCISGGAVVLGVTYQHQQRHCFVSKPYVVLNIVTLLYFHWNPGILIFLSSSSSWTPADLHVVEISSSFPCGIAGVLHSAGCTEWLRWVSSHIKWPLLAQQFIAGGVNAPLGTSFRHHETAELHSSTWGLLPPQPQKDGW